MSLFDRVINYVKSAGHAMEGEEHKLLNEFVAYLASEKVALGFSKSPVVASFAASSQALRMKCFGGGRDFSLIESEMIVRDLN
jgi:hypothetical protein